jgi:hypothetical protein
LFDTDSFGVIANVWQIAGTGEFTSSREAAHE